MFKNIFQLYAFFDLSQMQEFVPFLAKLKLQKILAIIVLLGVFVDYDIKKNFKIERLNSPIVKGLLFIVFWMMLSVPFSVHPGISFRFLTEAYWKNIILFFLIVAYGYSEKSIEKVVWAFILGLALYCLIGLLTPVQGRLTVSGSLDANELALYIVVIFSFAFWKIILLKGFKRLIPISITLVLILVLIKTGSRGGFLGLLGVVIVIFFQLRSHKKEYFLLRIAFLFLVFSSFFYFAPGQSWERISTIINYENDYNFTSKTGRIEVWQRGIVMIAENPILGVGAAAFMRAEGLSHGDEGGRWSAAHNSFLQVGAELGLPGLFVFCYLIFKSLKLLKNKIRLIKQSPPVSDFNKFIFNSIIAAWTGFIISGFFLSAAYTGLFIILIGLSCAYTTLPNKLCLSEKHK